MYSKIILSALVTCLILWATVSIWAIESDPVRYEQKKDLLSWVNSCPKDSILTMNSKYHWDKDTGETNMLVMICVTTDHKNDTAL